MKNKISQKRIVKQQYAYEINKPKNIEKIGTFNGGLMTPILLKNAIDLAESNNEKKVNFYDINNEIISLTILQARKVVLTISNELKELFEKKQDLISKINKCTTDDLSSFVMYHIKGAN